MNRDPSSARIAPRCSAGLLALAAASFVLIVLGALVRANGAGLACPDWPLCFGQLVPEFDMRVGFEWSHRLLAGLVSVGLLLITIPLLRQRPGRRIKRGLAVAWTLLLVQVVLGGLTVLLRLAPWTVAAHLLTGTAFFITLVWLAVDLRETHTPRAAAWREGPGIGSLSRGLIGLTALAVVGQLLLGGMVSSHGAGLACHAFPTCDGSQFFPTLSGLVGFHVLHRVNAVVLLLSFAALAFAVRRHPGVSRMANLAMHLVFLQALVGILNVLLRIPIEVTAVHSALASGISLCTGLLVRQGIGLPSLAKSVVIQSGAAPRRSSEAA